MKEIIEQRLERRIKERDHLQEVHQQMSQQLQQLERDLITATVAVQELKSLLKDDEEVEEPDATGGE